MSCNSCQQNVFSIFQGDNKSMPLKAVYSQSGDPLDLTSCTEIVVSLPNQDGTFATFKLSLETVTITSPAVIGKFTIQVSAIISALLNLGELQNFTVVFTIAGQIFTVQYNQALSVFEAV
jgi:hypothetical protein